MRIYSTLIKNCLLLIWLSQISNVFLPERVNIEDVLTLVVIWYHNLQEISGSLISWRACIIMELFLEVSNISISFQHVMSSCNDNRLITDLNGTLPETNKAPENGLLEYYFPFGMAYFQGRAVFFRECKFYNFGTLPHSQTLPGSNGDIYSRPRPKPVRCLDLTQLKRITRTQVDHITWCGMRIFTQPFSSLNMAILNKDVGK